jgi:hypothetical protein
MPGRQRGQGKTPHRQVRVEDDLWARFETARREAGATDRSAVLREFIQWYVHDRDDAGKPARMPKRPPEAPGLSGDE